MSINTEIEFKNLLTKEEYDMLLNYFQIDPFSIKKQINVYLDTPDMSLHKLSSALRVRIKSDLIELTLKQKGDKKAFETTDILTKSECDQLLNEKVLIDRDVSKALKKAGIHSSLTTIATLTTYRAEIEYEHNLIALDKSEYYGNEDYEIELETEDYDYGHYKFLELLNIFNIPLRKSPQKILRAISFKKDQPL